MATKSLLMGLLTGALVLGTGCATMGGKGSDTDTKPTPAAPTNGGPGLDPNPANNVQGSPAGIDGNPITAPGNPAAPMNSPPPGAVPTPGPTR